MMPRRGSGGDRVVVLWGVVLCGLCMSALFIGEVEAGKKQKNKKESTEKKGGASDSRAAEPIVLTTENFDSVETGAWFIKL
jgi:hypothetical protein